MGIWRVSILLGEHQTRGSHCRQQKANWNVARIGSPNVRYGVVRQWTLIIPLTFPWQHSSLSNTNICEQGKIPETGLVYPR